MDLLKVTSFLTELKDNNNREWFTAQKSRYEKEVKKPFEVLVGEVIKALQPISPELVVEPKDCIFRINRDVRFSADKRPYKENVSAAITPVGKKGENSGGIYFELRADKMAIGGGLYMPDKDMLRKVRQFILDDTDEFYTLVQDPEFVKEWGELGGERNKVMPPEFKEAAKEHPVLTLKQFLYWQEVSVSDLKGSNLVELIKTKYKAALRVSNFLQEAVKY